MFISRIAHARSYLHGTRQSMILMIIVFFSFSRSPFVSEQIESKTVEQVCGLNENRKE